MASRQSEQNVVGTAPKDSGGKPVGRAICHSCMVIVFLVAFLMTLVSLVLFQTNSTPCPLYASESNSKKSLQQSNPKRNEGFCSFVTFGEVSIAIITLLLIITTLVKACFRLKVVSLLLIVNTVCIAATTVVSFTVAVIISGGEDISSPNEVTVPTGIHIAMITSWINTVFMAVVLIMHILMLFVLYCTRRHGRQFEHQPLLREQKINNVRVTVNPNNPFNHQMDHSSDYSYESHVHYDKNPFK